MYNLEIYKVCRLLTNIKIKNTKCVLQLTLHEDVALLIISKRKTEIFSQNNFQHMIPPGYAEDRDG